MHSQFKAFSEKKGLFFFGASLFLVSIIIVAFAFFLSQLDSRLNRSMLLDVPRGSTILQLFKQIEVDGFIEINRPALRLFSKFTEDRGPIKAGKYDLVQGMTVREIIKLLRAGRVVDYRVTFPEGWTFNQWRKKLIGLPHLKKNIAGMSNHEIGELIGIKGDLEGWFFPDTYYYNFETSDLDLLENAFKRMKDIIALEWSNRSDKKILNTPYDAIILASLVEKETGYGPDRAKIGSVFLNRLRDKMKLESDPTVIYGLGDSFDGDLKRHHLRSDNPFNTYTRFGLPPTPIASPGRESIKVVLSEVKSPYYFFVAMGNGRSYFSKTYKEHLAAVKRYQLGDSSRIQ